MRYAVTSCLVVLSLSFIVEFFIRKHEFVESITHAALVALVTAFIAGICILVRRWTVATDPRVDARR